MNELVIMHDQQAVTTSLKVAEVFKKGHNHILRDISNLEKDVSNFGQMFLEATEPDSYGRNRRVYYMNRDELLKLQWLQAKASNTLSISFWGRTQHDSL